jgi:hypothetical protein
MSQSKSLLAKLLATENISIQRDASAETASFDIKSRVLILPVWQNISNDLEDMLVVHEVGHALDTPADGWMKGMESIAEKICGNKNDDTLSAVKGFLNVIEDARIDKRQKRRYPGSRRNYLIGYKELIDRDFFGTANREVNSYSFIDRVNMYFKGGFNAGIKFSSEEMPFVKRIEAAETFDEVVEITEAVFQYAKNKGEEQQQNMETLKIGRPSDEGDEGDDFAWIDDEDDEDFPVDGLDEDEDFPTNNTSSSMRGEGDIEAESDEKPKNSQSGSSNEGEYVPESETDNAWQKKMNQLLANDKTKYNYVTVPKVNIKNILSDYKEFLAQNKKAYFSEKGFDDPASWITTVRNDMVKYRNEDNATISFMVKEFEMKKSADIFSRISIAKTGVIDTNKIYSYKYNEDIFRRQSIIPEGKNHGFVMVLDWSGSMSGNIKETVKQLISLTSFCKRTQIPFEVYIFRDRNGYEYSQRGECFDSQIGDIKLENFTMRNILSSRMKANELIEAYTMLWAMARSPTKCDIMGGTPLNQAIVATEEIVNRFKASSKAQIVNVIFLTDGESNQISGIQGMQITKYHDYFTKAVNKYILQDKETGKEYHFNADTMYGEEVTVNLLKRLKDRTGVNLIGFYLYDYSAYNRLQSQFFGYNVDPKFSETMRKFWSENKFVPVQSRGYDDYYIINTSAMKDTENNLSVDSNMSKSKITKEFMKFSNKKSVNRILLKRFIDKVA